MRHRIWQEPGLSPIKITCYADDSQETIESANRVLYGEGHIHPLSQFLDTDDIHSVLPTQKRFLDDCNLVGGMVLVNRNKAEQRVLGDVRAMRDTTLAASDVLLLRAQEAGANVAQLAAYRQELRDLPQKVNLSALTLDELAAYQPVLPVAP